MSHGSFRWRLCLQHTRKIHWRGVVYTSMHGHPRAKQSIIHHSYPYGQPGQQSHICKKTGGNTLHIILRSVNIARVRVHSIRNAVGEFLFVCTPSLHSNCTQNPEWSFQAHCVLKQSSGQYFGSVLKTGNGRGVTEWKCMNAQGGMTAPHTPPLCKQPTRCPVGYWWGMLWCYTYKTIHTGPKLCTVVKHSIHIGETST